MDSLGQSLNVAAGDASNRDTSVAGAVDRVLLGKSVNLFGREASVAEHANLGGDVVPVLLGTKSLEVLLEKSSHSNHAVSHVLDFLEPLSLELRVGENDRGNAGTVDRGVRVEWSNDNLKLGINASLFFRALSNKGEGTNALTVETHVLGKRLAEGNLEALLDKVSDGVSVAGNVARGKALVGHVEEGEVALLLEDLSNGSPLLWGGINTGGVVGAGVQENDRAVVGVAEVLDEAVKVQGNVLLVVVSVGNGLDASLAEDSLVVGPGGVREEDLLLGEELGNELSADTESTGTGDGLGDGKSVLGDDRGVVTVGELGGGGGEFGDAGDAGVLLVEVLVKDGLVSLSHRGKDKGLTLVVAVGADTKVDLLLERVLLEGLGDTEDGVRRALGHVGPGGLEGDSRSQGLGSQGDARDGGSTRSKSQHCERQQEGGRI